MKKQIFQILVVFIFFGLFGYFYGDQYWNFQSEKEDEYNFQEKVTSSIQDFSLEDINEISEEIDLLVTPNLDLLNNIVEEMDFAQEKIYVEVYIFTEKKMRDAIIRAYNRGIDIKILLENNPYKAPYLNDKHYNAFEEAGIDVRWSDPINYSLNHSKLLIIDKKAYISTGNFSYSLFKYNRDFLVALNDVEILKKLENLFLSDFEYKKVGVLDPNLVISPDYSREKMEQLLLSAQDSIDFYFPYMADASFEKIIFGALQKGVKVRAIVEKSFYNDEKNKKLLNNLRNKGGKISYLGKYKLHAKAILVDKRILYIGSINFSSYSLDENREIGILIENKKIIEKFQNIFKSDLFLWQVKKPSPPLKNEYLVYNSV